MNPQTVVITGSTSGIGRATARRFAEQGDRVALLARDERALEETRAELEDRGAAAVTTVSVDVADADAVDRAASAVEEDLGPIDVWVNGAMTAVLAKVRDTPADEFRRVMEVTSLGQVHGTLAALARMLPRDHGTIVNVSSALAYRGIPLQATYCAAKHAVVGFTESLRTELLADGSAVAVTMVALPGVNTPQFEWVRARTSNHPQPVPPIYQPEVCADAIVHAAAHSGRREYKVGASTVGTIWGNRLAASLLDRYLAHGNIQAQQTDEPLDPDRPDYLFSPVHEEGLHRVHGRFDAKAYGSSLQWDLNKRLDLRKAAALVGLAAAGVGAALARSR